MSPKRLSRRMTSGGTQLTLFSEEQEFLFLELPHIRASLGIDRRLRTRLADLLKPSRNSYEVIVSPLLCSEPSTTKGRRS